LKFIPVLDLIKGNVVHAQRGERAQYAPIQSHLCANAHPVNITAALLSLFPFSILYIADIDSIQGSGSNQDTISRLQLEFPNLNLWVDRGISSLLEYKAWRKHGLGQAVIGTENNPKPELIAAPEFQDTILSLDYRDSSFIGPNELKDQAQLWPQNIIVMALARVGSNRGPDFERLPEIKALVPNKNVYAAGGVRSVADLEQLHTLGVTGVLMASAFHEGKINRSDIERFV